jgi:hypothetical protein
VRRQIRRFKTRSHVSVIRSIENFLGKIFYVFGNSSFPGVLGLENSTIWIKFQGCQASYKNSKNLALLFLTRLLSLERLAMLNNNKLVSYTLKCATIKMKFSTNVLVFNNFIPLLFWYPGVHMYPRIPEQKKQHLLG